MANRAPPSAEKTILDLCAGTGAWSKPYKEAGYDVRLIDIDNGQDVRLYVPREDVYGVLAAPPCTHLASSGARWWEGKGEEALIEALSIVDGCLRIIWKCRPKFWALENPVGRLSTYLGKPKMYFDPCDYGDAWTKRTCLWGRFNAPQKRPVKVRGKNPIWHMSPGRERGRLRSITPSGFAQAFFEANR